MLKINGRINKYTSISWFIEQNELQIYTDGGRYCRPLYIINPDNHYKMENMVKAHGGDFSDKLSSMNWEQLLTGDDSGSKMTKDTGGYIEYLDTNEEENSMIAIFPADLVPGKLHDLPETEEIVLQLGHKESRFTLKHLDPETGSMQVKKYIESQLPEKFHEDWRKVREVEVVDYETSKIKLKVDPDNADTRNVLKYLNRLLYSNYVVYTHAELHPCLWHGVLGLLICFPDHTQAPRVCYQCSMGKQAIGTFATNHRYRTDTMANTLVYPHRPLVQPRTAKWTNMNQLPCGYQAIVAIACYGGYNQEDSVLVNRGAIEKGMFNSIYSHTYTNKCQKHRTANTSRERFGIPPLHKTRSRRVTSTVHNPYHAIDEDSGVPRMGSYVAQNDILIAKYKKAEGAGSDVFDDASTTNREPGIVDLVIPDDQFNGVLGRIQAVNSEGNDFVKARVSSLRIPIIGDKVASRSAQKGTMGMMYDPADMPFTKDGMIPDIIMNPHAIPSRMTISQLIEALLSKSAVVSGDTRDATPFTEFNMDDVKEE